MPESLHTWQTPLHQSHPITESSHYIRVPQWQNPPVLDQCHTLPWCGGGPATNTITTNDIVHPALENWWLLWSWPTETVAPLDMDSWQTGSCVHSTPGCLSLSVKKHRLRGRIQDKLIFYTSIPNEAVVLYIVYKPVNKQVCSASASCDIT